MAGFQENLRAEFARDMAKYFKPPIAESNSNDGAIIKALQQENLELRKDKDSIEQEKESLLSEARSSKELQSNLFDLVGYIKQAISKFTLQAGEN